MRRFVPALCLAMVPSLDHPVPPLPSPQDFLDRGTFVISRNGSPVGREEFAIRPTVGRQGQGGVLAVSTVRLEGRELQHALELTSDHRPVTFQQTEAAGGRVVRRLSAQLSGVRYSARVTSSDGEAAREFPVSPPAVILGDEAYNEYYFVPRPTDGEPRPVSVVRPGDVRAVPGTVAAHGTDTVTVGDRRIEARRFALRLQDGDERLFWLTPQGDLVRIEIPATSTIATRAELPHR